MRNTITRTFCNVDAKCIIYVNGELKDQIVSVPSDTATTASAEKYIRKGTKLYVEGKLRTRVWEDRNTIKHTVTEILVDQFDILSRPPQAQQPAPEQNQEMPF